jgi:hypothetical protein
MAALTLTAAAMPQVGANDVVGDVASTPTSYVFDGVKAGKNSNGTNSASYTFASGSVGADTIANAELLKGVYDSATQIASSPRLYEFLSASYVTQVALDAAIAALGIVQSSNGASLLRFVTAAPGVPTATITTQAATGSIRIALGASIGA